MTAMAQWLNDHCAMPPPFGVPVIHKYLRIVRKIESCSPTFGIWAEKRAECG